MSDSIPAAVPSPLRIAAVNAVSALIAIPLLLPLAWLLRSLLDSPRAITGTLPGMLFAYGLLLPSVLLVSGLAVGWIAIRICRRIGMRALPLAPMALSVGIAGLVALVVVAYMTSMMGVALGLILALGAVIALQLRIYRSGRILASQPQAQPAGNTFRITPADVAQASAPAPAVAPATAAQAAQMCVQLVQAWRTLEARAQAQMPVSGEGLLAQDIHATSQQLAQIGTDAMHLAQRLQGSIDVNERYASDLLGRLAGAAMALGAVARWEEWRVAADGMSRLTNAMTASDSIRDWVRRMYATAPAVSQYA